MPLFNRVWFNVSGTPGTGAVTVGTAVSGYQTPAAAGVPNGNVCSYTAVDGLAWETGKVTYTVSGTSCARSMLESSTGSLLSLSSTATMAFQAIAEDLAIATESQAEIGTDSAAIMTSQAVSQAGAANARSFANVAGRNGGFEVWQRGTAILVLASTVQYTADGWYILANANQQTIVSRQPGNTNGSSYSCLVRRFPGQTGTGTQVFAFPLDVDELKKMAGQSVILQFNVAAGGNWSPAGGTLTYALITGTGAPVKQYTGSYVGTVNAIVSTVNLVPGAAATTVYSAVVAIPANIGQAEIQFQWIPVGTAGSNDSFQIDDVDLRVVPAGIAAIKPAFERSDYVWDYQRCVWHAEVMTAAIGGTYPGFAALDSSSSLICTTPYAAKRAPPTLTWNGTFAFRSIGSGGANLTLSSQLISVASVQSAFWSATVSGGVNGAPGLVRDLPGGGSSSILIDAGI